MSALMSALDCAFVFGISSTLLGQIDVFNTSVTGLFFKGKGYYLECTNVFKVVAFKGGLL